MGLLHEILDFNERFVEDHAFEPYKTTKFPDKKLVILSCMDTRLSELLPRAMNLKNGDAKIIKSAGAIITHPFGGVMRSILVAIYEFRAEEVCVIGHYGCGMASLDPDKALRTMIDRGIPQETIDTIQHSGIDLTNWLHGFGRIEESVQQTVQLIQHHPLMLPHIPVHGLIMDPDTGKLDVVVEDY